MTNGITRTSAVIESILSRSGARYEAPELVQIGTPAPASFHLLKPEQVPDAVIRFVEPLEKVA